ncbi:MAG: hypothetical protein NC187_06535 [Candidatus Amulumruptor caecigallinarius]|nr:hypothetical protein [Candidatus Amulumruptor caecigallinarius]MCM1397126.1 hypothetical protein [Candidatus Amulumruptor caecigallinarius]MCM1453936.1 hypothetical protein [bacterium]
MKEKLQGTILVSGTFSLLTFELLSLADKGCSIPMDKFMGMCNDYTIMLWLKDHSRYYACWNEDAKIILAEKFCALANCVIPEDTFGVAHNGVLALAAFCVELINQGGHSRERKHCDCAEEALKRLGLL